MPLRTSIRLLILLGSFAMVPRGGHAAGPAVPVPATKGAIEMVEPQSTQKQVITPCLGFNGNAGEAIAFYRSIFEDSKIVEESRWGEGGPVPKGTLLAATIELAGQRFLFLNSGPKFQFSHAFSLLVNCQTQAEIDAYWEKLSAGGKPIQCGWLTDRFGVTWQVVPTALGKMLSDPDPKRVARVMTVMMPMVKLDLAKLQEAYRDH